MPSAHNIQLLLTLALAAGPISGWAATNGALGSSSTGRVSISLQVPGQVSLSNLTDIEPGGGRRVSSNPTPPNSNPLAESSVACVFARGGSGYQVVASGSGPAPSSKNSR